MKNYFKILWVAIALVTMSCTSDDSDDDNSNNAQVVAEIQASTTSGEWYISSYIDSGQDETSNFSGYTFTFSANGSITAANGNTTVNGTWSVTVDDDSNDDNPSSSDDVDFNIMFASPATFADLSDDWDITAYSNTSIQLIDVSGGNGGTDYLVFQKN